MALAGDILLRVRAQGVAETTSQLRQLGNTVRSLRDNIEEWGGAIGAVGTIITAIGTYISLEFADTIETIRFRFMGLTGSIDEANRALERIFRIAERTKFDVTDVADFAAMLMTTGISAELAAEEVKKLMDLFAGMGVARSDFDRIAFNLLQLRSGAGTAADVRQMVAAMPGIGRAIAMAMGRTEPFSVKELSELINTIGGEEFYQLILRASQACEGSSEMLTLGEMIQNLVERIKIALLPTTELLVSVFKRLIAIISPLVDGFEILNRYTFGLAGLALFLASLGILARAFGSIGKLVFNFFSPNMGAFLMNVGVFLRNIFQQNIWVALLTYQKAVQTTTKVLYFFGRLFNILGFSLLVVVDRIISFFLNIFRIIPSVLKSRAVSYLFVSVIRFINTIGGIFFILGLLGTLLSKFIPNKVLAEQIGVLSESVSIGATFGALLGSFIPVIGTIAGGFIGAALGAIVGYFRARNVDPSLQAQQQTARNTARMVQQLEDIRINIIGGGDRTRLGATRYEVEAYLRQLALRGI